MLIEMCVNVMVFIDKWLVGDEKIVWFAWLFYIAVAIGTWKLVWFILTPILMCLKPCCRPKQDLLGKYGRADKSAYAVVTGGSDGIGLELCH